MGWIDAYRGRPLGLDATQVIVSWVGGCRGGGGGAVPCKLIILAELMIPQRIFGF